MICVFLSIAIRIVLAVAPIPTSAPASSDHPATQPNALEGRAKAEADYAGLPRRDVDSIVHVLRIVGTGKQIFAQPLIENLPRTTRLIIADMPGVATMNISPLPPPDVNAPRDFSYKQFDFAGSGESSCETITDVTVAAGLFSFARFREDATVTTTVQFTCDAFDLRPDLTEPAVTLYITVQGKKNPDGDLQVKRTADSFRDLRLQFPDDVDRYVRPIVRRFKQEAVVFAPDAHTAWQVLMQDWQPDEQTVEKVKSIVVKLDADDFQERSAAQSALKKIGEPAAIILYRMDRAKLSPETQSAIDLLLEPYIQLTADDVKKLRDDKSFLVDALSDDDPTLRKLAWQRLQSIAHPTEHFDPDADATTRAAAIDKLADSVRQK